MDDRPPSSAARRHLSTKQRKAKGKLQEQRSPIGATITTHNPDPLPCRSLGRDLLQEHLPTFQHKQVDMDNRSPPSAARPHLSTEQGKGKGKLQEQRSPTGATITACRARPTGFMAEARRVTIGLPRCPSVRTDDEDADRTIFISNIPPGTDDCELREMFKQFGQIDKVHLHSHMGDVIVVNCTVIYKVSSAAHAAVDFYNNMSFKGFRLSVTMAQKPYSTQDDVPPAYKGSDFVLKPLGTSVKRSFVLRNEIYSELKPFQKDSMGWFWRIHCTGNGGLLADDMGLGKTRQILAFLDGLLQSNLIRRALIVVPRTIICQWLEELKDVGLLGRTYVFKETKTRLQTINDIEKYGGLMLTTHTLASNHWNSLNISWDYLIIDEAQVFHKTTLVSYANLERIVCGYRILLSGTPAPNSLKELYVLLNFCSPGVFDNVKDFNESYLHPLVHGNYMNSSKSQLEESSEAAEKLQNRIRSCFLRRMKSVLSSPEMPDDKRLLLAPKTEFAIWLKLTPYQEQLYRILLSEVIDNNSRRHTFVIATLLQKICSHPKQLKAVSERVEEGGEQAGALDLGERISLRRMIAKLLSRAPPIEEDDEEDQHSCKLEFIVKLLERFKAQKHRVLIFSRTCEMLDVIEEVLERKDFRFDRIDGSLTSSVRARRLQAFKENTEPPILLISSFCGGTGLNLPEATRAIIVEPFWNPSVDDQCSDRIYRINQLNECFVYKLLTSETIEEQVYQRQIAKSGLFKAATESTDFKRYITKELKNMILDLPPSGFGSSRTLQLLENDENTDTLSTDAMDELNFLKNQNAIGVSIHSKLFSGQPTKKTTSASTSKSISECWGVDENFKQSERLEALKNEHESHEFGNKVLGKRVSKLEPSVQKLRTAHMEEITKLQSNAIDKT